MFGMKLAAVPVAAGKPDAPTSGSEYGSTSPDIAAVPLDAAMPVAGGEKNASGAMAE